MQAPSKLRTLVILALLTAILVLAQVTLAVLPNVELVSILCLVYTLFYRKQALAIIYLFVLVEELLFGIGIWWINYLYIWTILWAVAMLLSKMHSTLGWAIVLGAFGLLFGLLTAIPYLFIGGVSMAFSYWLTGIPFDILHCLGNVVAVLLLFRPLCRVFERLTGHRFYSEPPHQTEQAAGCGNGGKV